MSKLETKNFNRRHDSGREGKEQWRSYFPSERFLNSPCSRSPLAQVLNERYGCSILSSPAGQMSKTNCWENTSNLNVFLKIIYGLFFLSPSARFNKIYTSTEWLLFYQDVFRWNITSMSNLALSFSFHTFVSEGIIKLGDCRLDPTQIWVPKA